MNVQPIIDGYIENRTPIKVWEENGVVGVLAGGEKYAVERRDVLRDGGTVVYELSGGHRLTFPHRFNDDDRTPKFDGYNITGYWSGAK